MEGRERSRVRTIFKHAPLIDCRIVHWEFTAETTGLRCLLTIAVPLNYECSTVAVHRRTGVRLVTDW